jgi:hypothetical protein
VRSVLATTLLAAMAFSIGCGGTPAAAKNPHKTLTLSWTSDGNPTVPACGTSTVNCKANLVVIDLNTGKRTFLSLTTTTYKAPNTTDTYVVHVVGYDLNGTSIESACCSVVLK